MSGFKQLSCSLCALDIPLKLPTKNNLAMSNQRIVLPNSCLYFQLIIPERLAESIQHLRCDEGLESTSNPATPVPTPISPIFAQQGGQRAHQVLPEQVSALRFKNWFKFFKKKIKLKFILKKKKQKKNTRQKNKIPEIPRSDRLRYY